MEDSATLSIQSNKHMIPMNGNQKSNQPNVQNERSFTNPWEIIKKITHIRTPVALLCLIAIGIVLFLIILLTSSNSQTIQDNLETLCNDRGLAIANAMNFVSASTNVETALYDIWPDDEILTVEFGDFYAHYLSFSRGQSYFFDRLAFTQRVMDKNRNYFENVFPKIKILEVVVLNETGGQFVPLNRTLPDYFVWTYGGSYESSSDDIRIGWDVFSFEHFQDEIEASIANNTVGVTNTFTFTSGNFVAMIAPVHDRSIEMIPDDDASRWKYCTGLFIGRIYVDNIVSQAMNDRDPVPVLVEILDQRKDNMITYAYFGGQQADANYNETLSLDRRYVVESEIDSRWRWKIRCIATEQYSANNSVVWFWIFLICLGIFAASIMLAVYIQKDLTHLKRVEHEVGQRTLELEQAWIKSRNMSRVAEKANGQKTKFISYLCHELRTPLHEIVALSGFLRDTFLNEDQKQFVLSLQTSANLMTTIVNDVMDLSKVESGDLILEKVPIDIRHLVKTICVSQHDRCRKKGIQLISTTDDEVPNSLIGDPTRISQILYNLTSNAIKFTEQGSVQVVIKGHAQESFAFSNIPRYIMDSSSFILPIEQEETFQTNQTYWLEISVIDSGIGIDSKAFPRLFDAYSQEKLSTMRNYGGTGLGLAICKHLTSKMGGHIRIESKLNMGTCFTIIIGLEEIQLSEVPVDDQKYFIIPDAENLSPVSNLPKEEEPKIMIERQISSIGSTPSLAPSDVQLLEAHLQGVRVLYADDQPINRKLMERFFKDCNPILICVENGLEAVRCVQQVTDRAKQVKKGMKTLASRIPHSTSKPADSPSERIRKLLPEKLLSFDIILLDINMPVMDGKEAASLIRDMDSNIPIVAVTANVTTAEDKTNSEESLFDDFAPKPLRREHLLQLVQHWVTGGRKQYLGPLE